MKRKLKTKAKGKGKLVVAKKKETELSLVKQKDVIRKETEKQVKLFDKQIDLNTKLIEKGTAGVNKWSVKRIELLAKADQKLEKIENRIRTKFHKPTEEIVAKADIRDEQSNDEVPF